MTAPFHSGLVVGKFYPPHRGHLHLIETAAARCERLTVLVMAAASKSVPLPSRVQWLAAACARLPAVMVIGVRCDVPVDYGSAPVWAAQVAVMTAVLDGNGLARPDAVFTSETYGDELAERFAATPVCVDPGRATVPVSATQVRADLAANWGELIGPAQAGLAARVVVLGAESTGTSTVAELLAAHYRRRGAFALTRCVPEAGRDYTVTKWALARAEASAAGRPQPPLDSLTWTHADFDAVATAQTRLEDEAAAAGSPLVVCDTDAFATSVWERRYLGAASRGLQPWATTGLPRHDVYLVTSHEGVPWHDDGLREGDLAIRGAMTGWFTAALTAAGHSWVLLTGTLEQRLELAVRTTDLVLAQQARFGPAITDSSVTDGTVPAALGVTS
jgi:HTH-type transcriptional regulator, transcriptional repressor of NAD biosynthesis genes